MADVDAILEAAHLKNDHVREYVRYWAGITGADNIEVVSADDGALPRGAPAQGEQDPRQCLTRPSLDLPLAFSCEGPHKQLPTLTSMSPKSHSAWSRRLA